jgi:hypothetical protein
MASPLLNVYTYKGPVPPALKLLNFSPNLFETSASHNFAMSSLCFREAVVKRKNNEITEDEYLQALVSHCSGVCHGVNKLCNDDAVLPADIHPSDAYGYGINDSFTWAVAKWIYYNFGTSVEGSTL